MFCRVYGIGTEAIIDRFSEINNMKKLHAIGAGSELYATFNNGIAYEYMHGALLCQENVRNPGVYSMVAKMLAKVHCINIEESHVFSNVSCAFVEGNMNTLDCESELQN